MKACQLWRTLCLLAAYWACAPAGASHSSNAKFDSGFPQRHRSLLTASQEVSSPDVLLNGACSADIVQHCRHLLTEEVKGTVGAKTNAGQEAAAAVISDAAANKPLKPQQAEGQQSGTAGASGSTISTAAGSAAASQTQQATSAGPATANGAAASSDSTNAKAAAADAISGSATAAGAAAGGAAGASTTQTGSGGGGGGSTATGNASTVVTIQQQQSGTQQRRRHLMGEGADVASVAAEATGIAVGAAVAAELNAASAHIDDLGRALHLLGLRSELNARAMASATAPLARCLLSAMHASQMSINPNIPLVSDACKAEVRSVLVQRASDMQYDPPLLSACAHDILAHCGDLGPDSAAVVRCLKASKPRLLPLCRAAVTTRQAAAAEDLSLDLELQRSCGAERDKLCLEAGWGEGAAQMCLLGHLRGSLPQVFSQLIFPVAGREAGPGTVMKPAATGGSGSGSVELSANCSAALVRRMIEEGEDIRFNYRLSSACAGDKQVLCRDLRPGGAAVLNCLERHLDSPDMSEDCGEALSEVRQLRSLDVRLDHTFMVSCAGDVRSLCREEVAGQLKGDPEEVPFGLSAPFECLRGRLELVRDATCRRRMYESLVAAYKDNRLDAGLMRGCHQEVALLCSQHPPRALDCLQDKIDKFTREDSPAVLKGKISEQCMSVVQDRRTQAATDVAFVPELMDACAREHAAMCSAPDMEGVRALDCLADHRSVPGFSERCSEALREYLAEAARDIRTMAGLSKDCGEEISTLCKGVQPGEGRVISCLRDRRADISGEACRQQVMRLLGFMVEDHRMDARMMEVCTSDVQKYCGGVEAGDGQVHDCLRRSLDHLSPECRAAEEEVERLEHEDVRLNPALKRECPLAISSFCADVPPGDARVISCLQANMDKGHFPAGCRLALRQLTDREVVKYSLNYRLRQECDEDTQRLCPEAVDEFGTGRQSMTGTGGSHREETTLACLARQSAQLAPGCRSELQALVKLSLNRYRVGMPLTSQCDGDVMQRCQVDQVAAPFLQRGYVLSCLAKHAAKLHKPCWELVSTMDEGHFKRAVAAETTAWQQSQPGGLVLDEKLLERLAADLRRELEPRIYSNVHEQINRKAVVVARNVTGALVMTIAPRVNALVHTTSWLLGLTIVGLLGGLLAWRKFMARGSGVLVVRKDGRV